MAFAAEDETSNVKHILQTDKQGSFTCFEQDFSYCIKITELELFLV